MRERRRVREGNIRLRPCRPTDEEEGAMQKEAAEPRRERSSGKGLRRRVSLSSRRRCLTPWARARSRGSLPSSHAAALAEGVAAAASPSCRHRKGPLGRAGVGEERRVVSFFSKTK